MKYTFTDIPSCPRDRFIDVADGAARLVPSFLLMNERGVNVDVSDEITDRRWAKVRFFLYAPPSRGATLLWFVDWIKADADPVPWRILVNGHEILHLQDMAKMLTGGWDRIDLPARFLRAGDNEIVFADHGRLHVDPGVGGNSFRSFDGGRTWHEKAFGPDRRLSGEYLVRLRVKGHPPAGTITSPVFDLADPDRSRRIAPRMDIRSVKLSANAKTPKGTSIVLETRTGTGPCFDPAEWTPWSANVAAGVSARLSAGTAVSAGSGASAQAGRDARHHIDGAPTRFFQWRAHLHTDKPALTPALKSVTLDVDAREDPVGAKSYHVVEWKQPELARSSYEFTYLAPHPRQQRLVKQYRLDEIVAPGQTDLEKLTLLCEWIFSQWYGWQSDRYPWCPTWDPLDVLDTVKGNWGYGMCTHYGAMMAGCAAALGYAARSLIVDHHCLAEVWIPDLGKWILMDAGLCNESYARYELDDQPLNALEVHQAIAAGRAKDLRERLLPQNVSLPMRQALIESFCRFAIPLRNNHLVQAEPAEHQHGQSQYRWDGYLWWTDDADPKFPEYSLQTRREADFYWSVGLTRIHLQVMDDLGHLDARLEHTMPNFVRYEARINGNAWKPVEAQFEWKLSATANTLEARAVDAFGRAGPPTMVQVFRGRKEDAPTVETRRFGGVWTQTRKNVK